MKNKVYEIGFPRMKMISEEHDGKRAVLTKIHVVREEEQFLSEDNNEFGIYAVAEINIPFEVYTGRGKGINWLNQEITTGGLWGIHEDTDEGYIKDVEADEIENLLELLKVLNVVTEHFTILNWRDIHVRTNTN